MKKTVIFVMFIVCAMFAYSSSSEIIQNDIANNIYSSSDFYILDKNFDIVEAKNELAMEYQGMQIELSYEEDILLEESIHNALADFELNHLDEAYLLDMGIVKLDLPYAKLNSDASDVTIGAVSIFFHYYTGTWFLSGTGYWNNDAYCDDGDGGDTCDSIWNHAGNYGIWNGIGDTDDIGGRDSVGIHLHDTGTVPSGLTLLSGYGRFYMSELKELNGIELKNEVMQYTRISTRAILAGEYLILLDLSLIYQAQDD